MIVCETTSDLKFSIHFFKSKDLCVLVAIERLQGSGYEMQQFRRTFLPFVKTGRLVQSRRSPRPVAPLVKQMYKDHCSCKKTMGRQISDNSCCDEVMIRCKSLLQSDKLDDLRQGLELLSCMMNRENVNTSVSEKVSRALVFNEAGTCSDQMRENIVSVLDDQSAEQPSLSQSKVTNAALRVLTRALDMALTIDRSDDSGLDTDSPFWRRILVPLKSHAATSSANPHVAAMAIKCLLSMVKLDSKIFYSLQELTLLPILVQAHETGKQCHHELEVNAHDLLGYMGEATFLAL